MTLSVAEPARDRQRFDPRSLGVHELALYIHANVSRLPFRELEIAIKGSQGSLGHHGGAVDEWLDGRRSWESLLDEIEHNIRDLRRT